MRMSDARWGSGALRLAAMAFFIAWSAALGFAGGMGPAKVVETAIRNTDVLFLMSPRLRALQEADAKRDVDAIGTTWIAGGNDEPKISKLKLKVLAQTSSAATVRATFRNYGEKRERTFYLVRVEGAWLIDDAETEWAKRISAELAASTGASEPSQEEAAGPTGQEGKYCLKDGKDETIFTTRPKGKDLVFALSWWTPYDTFFGVTGTAKPASSGWRFEENLNAADPRERCAVVITAEDGGYRVSTVDGARCESLAGHNAVLYGTISFSPASRVSAKFDASEVGNLDCK